MMKEMFYKYQYEYSPRHGLEGQCSEGKSLPVVDREGLGPACL